MPKLAPSILSADFSALGAALLAVEKAGAHYIHFDVMDGNFVPNISFGVPVLHSIRRSTGLVFDVHLMVAEPLRFVPVFAEAGADIITVHGEIFADEPEILQDCIRKIKGLGKKVGLAINPHTPLDTLLTYVEQADLVLIMSVEPGFGGQILLPFTLDKAERLASFIRNRGLETEIEMDGGIDINNLPRVLSAGVNVVVAGSSIFERGDIGQAVGTFLEAFGQYETQKKKGKKR